MSQPAKWRAHNARQIDYFANTHKRTMQPRSTPYLERHVDELLRVTGLSADMDILEVGCGIGRYTILLLARGFRVEGLDLTSDLLRQLREHLPRGVAIPLHACDIVTFPETSPKRYDAAIGFFAAHHFHDLSACFGAMARVVKPGGLIAFLEPNGWNPLYYIQMAVTPGMTWEGDKGVAQMRPGPMFASMARVGLQELAVERFGFFPPFLANRSWGARLERYIERIPPLRPILPFQIFHGRVPG